MSDSESNFLDEAMQVTIDAVEEIVITLIEAVRERPGVAAAILAGVMGAFVGLAIAAITSRRREAKKPRKRAGRLFAGVASALDLEERSHRVSKETRKSAKRVDKKTGGVMGTVADIRSAADLVPVAMQLAENPLVRSVVAGMVAKQMRRRFG